jgi:hypothetical protein
LPAKRFTPRMANIRNTITMTRPTFKIEGIEAIRASIRVFIEELCDKNLKGLRIRKSLNTFKNAMLTPSRDVSMRPVVTMKKSI